MADFWAITAYFNPLGYLRRRQNYRLFRQHLEVPLLTVELGYGDFELGEDDADILVQIRGRDVMWQKERLLNHAVEALPASCTNVAWLDSDLIFQTAGWSSRTARLLDDCALVQPFSRVLRMAADWRPGETTPGEHDVLHALARRLGEGMSIESCLAARGEASGTALGMGWAARRELLASHGMYDANILGDGDWLMLSAAFGCFDEAAAHQRMTPARAAHFEAWARPFHQAVRGRVAYAEGDVAHLWHGALADRRYAERIEDFSAFDYNPGRDVADDSGAWRWSSAKPAMHAFVRGYFAARREDGTVTAR